MASYFASLSSEPMLAMPVRDYVLTHGIFPYFEPQKAMLNALARPDENVHAFGRDVATGAHPIDMIAAYATAGAFASAFLFSCFKERADAEPLGQDLVVESADAARRLIENDPLIDAIERERLARATGEVDVEARRELAEAELVYRARLPLADVRRYRTLAATANKQHL